LQTKKFHAGPTSGFIPEKCCSSPRRMSGESEWLTNLNIPALIHEHHRLYDKYGRTYLFDMDFWHLDSLKREQQKVSDAKALGAPSTSQTSTASDKDERRTASNTYTIDAFHVGNVSLWSILFFRRSTHPTSHSQFTRFLVNVSFSFQHSLLTYLTEPLVRSKLLYHGGLRERAGPAKADTRHLHGA
jgi:hypothetical protein